MKFEDLLKLSPGDQVSIKDPIFGKMNYVLVLNDDGRLDFLNFAGSSLLVDSQKTVDAFEVALLDRSEWNAELGKAAKIMNDQLSKLKEMFGE